MKKLPFDSGIICVGYNVPEAFAQTLACLLLSIRGQISADCIIVC